MNICKKKVLEFYHLLYLHHQKHHVQHAAGPCSSPRATTGAMNAGIVTSRLPEAGPAYI